LGGSPEEAIAALETVYSDPNMPAQYAFSLGTAYYISRRHNDAVVFEREALRRPEEAPYSGGSAAAYGQLGCTAEAQRAAETVRRKLPKLDPQIFGYVFRTGSTMSISPRVCEGWLHVNRTACRLAASLE
jgi:hypothetical protein